MIREVQGDLLKCDADILCHQTNFSGIMGGGIAASIRETVLTDRQYREYQSICAEKGKALLGTVQYLPAKGGKTIANLFSQNDWNAGPVLTNYEALRACLNAVESYAREHGNTVALPGFIGCGIAGGDWKTVREIIEEVFRESPVDCTIVFWKKLFP